MNHHVKQQHGCGWITVVVYRRFFSFFACLKSLGQCTGSSEYWVSAFSEIDHHHLSSVVPQTVWLVGLRSVSLFFSSLFPAFSNRCRYPSTWRWFDLRTSQAGSCSPPSLFVFSQNNCSVVCPGKFLHLNTTGFPSVRSNSRYSWDFVNDSIFSFQASIDRGCSWILPRQSTES